MFSWNDDERSMERNTLFITAFMHQELKSAVLVMFGKHKTEVTFEDGCIKVIFKVLSKSVIIEWYLAGTQYGSMSINAPYFHKGDDITGGRLISFMSAMKATSLFIQKSQQERFDPCLHN